MKKHSSVWMLLVRSTLYKLLPVWAAAAGLQSLLFIRTVRQLSVMPDVVLELDSVIRQSHAQFIFGVGLMATALILSLIEWEQGAGFTLARLRVRPRTVYLCHAGYAFLCFLMYWAVQALLMLVLARWFGGRVGENFGPQGFFLACWSSRFLHGLYPLTDWAGLAKNLLIAAVLAAFTGRLPRPNTAEKRRFPKGVLMLSILAAWMFPTTFTTADTLSALLAAGAALVLANSLYAICRKEEQTDEED